MNILALCGSIREGSSSLGLLRGIRGLLHPLDQFELFLIDRLPFFDPQDQFGDSVPAVVQGLRRMVSGADFIFISTPEYAHGIPGVLKNALEWLVCEESMKKKTVVFVCSATGGEFVTPYLLETLRTMDLLASEDATFIVRSARKDVSADGQFLNLELKKSALEFLKNVGVL